MSNVSMALMKKLIERGMISPEDAVILIKKVTNEEIPQSVFQKWQQNMLARFGDDPEKKKLIEKGIEQARGSVDPYGHQSAFGTIPTFPNENFKITREGQQVGSRGILEPYFSRNVETVPWMDDKHQITLSALRDASEKGIPIELNTSSDLISKGGYREAVPKGSKVHLRSLTRDKDLNSILFPGNASSLRVERAADELAKSRPDVNVDLIEPSAEDVMTAYDAKIKRNGLLFGHQIHRKELESALKKPGTLNPKLLRAIVPAASLENPLDLIGEGVGKYEDLKKAVLRKAAEQMNFSGIPEDTENLTEALSFAADPINAVPGAPGVGLGLLQSVPRKRK
jgi:hypothetical protein